jgi:hypothetical protein
LIRQRREEAAASIRDQLDDLEAAMPGSGSGEAVLGDHMKTGDLVEGVRRRAALLRDDSISGCLDALSYALTVAILDAEEVGGKESICGLSAFPLAICAQRSTPTCFGRKRPTRSFPHTTN